MTTQLNAAQRLVQAADTTPNLSQTKMIMQDIICEGGTFKQFRADSQGVDYIAMPGKDSPEAIMLDARAAASIAKGMARLADGATIRFVALTGGKIRVEFDGLSGGSKVEAANHPGTKYMTSFVDEGGEPFKTADDDFPIYLFDVVAKNGGEVTVMRSDIFLVAVKNNKPLLAYDVELEETYLPK